MKSISKYSKKLNDTITAPISRRLMLAIGRSCCDKFKLSSLINPFGIPPVCSIMEDPIATFIYAASSKKEVDIVKTKISKEPIMEAATFGLTYTSEDESVYGTGYMYPLKCDDNAYLAAINVVVYHKGNTWTDTKEVERFSRHIRNEMIGIVETECHRRLNNPYNI